MDKNEFNKGVKESVAKAAAYCCSMCRRSTLRPIQGSLTETHYIGTIAHISAKSEGGPRYRSELKAEERISADNALFVCWNCHHIIDDKSSEHLYTEAWLKSLRSQHHDMAREVFDQVVPQDVTILGGALETEGDGDIAGVRIHNASAIFKHGFSSKVKGSGRLTNVEISRDIPGVARLTHQIGTGRASTVSSGSRWRCPRCGDGTIIGFSVAFGSPGADCMRCRIPMAPA